MEIVKVGRLKTNSRGNIEMSRTELKNYLNEYVEMVMMVTLLACISWLMDEPEYADDKDRLADIFPNIERIIRTTFDPDSGFDKKDLARVVEKGTGIKVRFRV